MQTFLFYTGSLAFIDHVKIQSPKVCSVIKVSAVKRSVHLISFWFFLCFNSLKLLSAKYKLHVRYIFAEQKRKKRTVYVIYIQMRLPLKEGAYISCRMEYLSPFS